MTLTSWIWPKAGIGQVASAVVDLANYQLMRSVQIAGFMR